MRIALSALLILLSAITCGRGMAANAPVEILKSGHLAVPAQINGQDVLLMVDTGASHTVLDAKVAKRIGVRSIITSERAAGVGCSRLWIEASERNRLQVGDVVTERFVLRVMDLSHSSLVSNSGRAIAGILGADWLRAHKVVISYADLTLEAK